MKHKSLNRTAVVVAIIALLVIVGFAPAQQVTRFRNLFVTGDITVGNDMTVGGSGVVTGDWTITGNLVAAGTAQALSGSSGTATPILSVNQTGLGQIASFRDAGTPIAAINDGGQTALYGPTAMATAAPLFVANQTGLGKVAEFQDGGSVVVSINNGGQAVFAGGSLFSKVTTADSAATNDYNEIAFTSPADTTGTNTHNALTIDLAIGNASGGTNNVRGVQIDGITGDAQVTETALNIGTGWDQSVNIGGGELTINPTVVDLNDTYLDQTINTENIGLPTVLSVPITYTDATGGSGVVATVGDGEIWFIHSVYVQVTTDFDAVGGDATLTVGDGGDANGLLDLVDAELQVTDTEGTGAPAGWHGLMGTGTRGAYLAEGLGFIYAPDGDNETIDWEVTGTVLSAGEATIYIVYTRVQ